MFEIELVLNNYTQNYENIVDRSVSLIFVNVFKCI